MSDVPFDLNFAPKPDAADVVAPGVRRITANNPSPHTFRGTNTYLLGEGAVTVIDPGPNDPAHVAAILAATAGERIERILLTHGHLDHTGAVAGLAARTGAPVHIGLGRPADASGGPESVAVKVEGAIPIRDGERIEGAGFALRAIATPGHASDHFSFALEGTDVLFSGDHVMGWSTTVVAPPDGSMAEYMRSLDVLLARPERRYLSGHGATIENGPEYTRALRAHRKMREVAILERIRKGDRTIPEIVAVLYRGIDPRLTRSASMSVLAHLEDLIARGVVKPEGAVALEGRFTPG